MKQQPKVVYLTAGAGGMYCGSCMRDNALAGELQSMGWDITLLPLYTPIRVEDEDRSVDQVFFGGINVYLQQKIPLFRYLPRIIDRWLDSPTLIRRVTSKTMSVDAGDLGALTYSMVRGENGFQRKEVYKLVEWLRDHLKPDLICMSNLLIGGSIPTIRRELPDTPLLVTLQGDDVFLDELHSEWRDKVISELKKISAQVDGFLTFSRAYQKIMENYLDLPAERFHITPLGIDVSAFDEVFHKRNTALSAPLTKKNLTYFARLCPEKGFDLLVTAFLQLAQQHPELNLVAGGWLSAKDEAFLAEQIERINQAGLLNRFHYLGSPDAEGKKECLTQSSVFCVPARFAEPKGLYALEAIASGIPVAAPNHGAFPEIAEIKIAGSLYDSSEENRESSLPMQLAKILTRYDQPQDLASDLQLARERLQQRGDRSAAAHATAEVFKSFIPNN